LGGVAAGLGCRVGRGCRAAPSEKSSGRTLRGKASFDAVGWKTRIGPNTDDREKVVNGEVSGFCGMGTRDGESRTRVSLPCTEGELLDVVDAYRVRVYSPTPMGEQTLPHPSPPSPEEGGGRIMRSTDSTHTHPPPLLPLQRGMSGWKGAIPHRGGAPRCR